MKKLVAILSLVLMIQSCGKDKKEEVLGSFTWSHQNVSHTTTVNAYISQSGLGMGPNQIIANNGTAPFYRVSIRLSSLNPNSYTVSLASNKFDYVDDQGFDQAGAQGTVTILSNSNNKLSGNFSVKLINASSDTPVITDHFPISRCTPDKPPFWFVFGKLKCPTLLLGTINKAGKFFINDQL